MKKESDTHYQELQSQRLKHQTDNDHFRSVQKGMLQQIEELTAEKHKLMQSSSSKNILSDELTKQQETISRLNSQITNL